MNADFIKIDSNFVELDSDLVNILGKVIGNQDDFFKFLEDTKSIVEITEKTNLEYLEFMKANRKREFASGPDSWRIFLQRRFKISFPDEGECFNDSGEGSCSDMDEYEESEYDYEEDQEYEYDENQGYEYEEDPEYEYDENAPYEDDENAEYELSDHVSDDFSTYRSSEEDPESESSDHVSDDSSSYRSSEGDSSGNDSRDAEHIELLQLFVKKD